MTGRYREVLRAPHVMTLLATSLVARLPIGIESLATVLFLRAETGSFAIGGAVAGGIVLGSGIGNPVISRMVDRLGVGRVLLPVAVAHAVAILGLLLLGRAGAPVPALIASAAVAGFTIPPTSSVLRSMWRTLLADRPAVLPTAYALESVLIELIFIAGPLVTAALVWLSGAGSALILCAVAVVVGTAAFVAQPPTRALRGQPAAPDAGWLGALSTPGMRTLVVTMAPVGVSLGAVEVALPAFGDAHGNAAWGGVLLAVWSVGSAAGGLIYGAREQRRELLWLWVALVVCIPLGVLPMIAAGPLWSMVLLVIPAGAAIAPLLATTNMLVSHAAPAGAATEAFTWPLTAMVAGIAAGNALGGALAEEQGWRAGVLLALGAGVLAIGVAALRRGTLSGAQPLAAGVP
jgi:predicted MFS family arabinose efflux permease